MPDGLDRETSSRCCACAGWGNVILSSSTDFRQCLRIFQKIVEFWYLAFFWTETYLKVLQGKTNKQTNRTLFLLFWNISCQQNWRFFMLRGTLKSYFLLQYMITSNNKTKTSQGSNFKMKDPNEHLIWMSWLFCLHENLHWQIWKKKKDWEKWADIMFLGIQWQHTFLSIWFHYDLSLGL